MGPTVRPALGGERARQEGHGRSEQNTSVTHVRALLSPRGLVYLEEAAVGIVRMLRGLLLTGPCRLYVLGQDGGGAVPYLFLAAGAVVVAVCGGAGALWGLAMTAGVREGFLDGIGVGLIAVVAWTLYAAAVLIVLWVIGKPPDLLLTAAHEPTGRHAGPGGEVEWRERGDRLVPGSLVGVLALMAVFGLGSGLWTRQAETAYAGPKVMTQADVVRWEDSWSGFGERQVVARYAVGSRVLTVRTDAEDIPGTIPHPGQRLAVEYLRNQPTLARPAGTAATQAEDWHGFLVLSGICAGLATAAGAAYLVGVRRRRPPAAPER
jgi:hypothetical protein